MDSEEMTQLLHEIILDYNQQGAIHSGLDYDEIKSFLGPFTSEDPGGVSAVENAIRAYLKTSVRTDHPAFLRAFWGGSEPASVVASLISDIRNTTMHSYAVAPSATIVETEMIKAISELAGFPGYGIFTTGGSNSNEMGFLCAREEALPGSSKTGIGNERLCAFSSAESHYSVDAAANMMGIGTDSLIRIPCVDGKMDPAALNDAIIEAKERGDCPFIVLSTAGTTVRGAFDDLDAISDIAQAHGIWHHVDAAWGGAVLFSKKYKFLLDGLERADSFSFDAHKMLGSSMVCSAFIVQDEAILPLTMAHTNQGDYLFDDPNRELSLGRISPQCGRRADALKLWLTWLDLGTKGLGERVESCLDVSNHLANLVKNHEDFTLVSHSFSNVCIRFTPQSGETQEEGDIRIRKARNILENSGKSMVLDSVLDGLLVIRFTASHPSVDKAAAEKFLSDLLDADA
ncbi:MAG: pyridoxal-dependent decarboxylase [Candidatus Thalassarchaeaceae archaeon]|nr:pyridoxal-dependent decarboxylase [Candidatus Thalassarchaeaceae archaeon]